MPAIHLIQKEHNLRPKPVTPGGDIYTNGYWDLTQERATTLVGGNIYFHKKQAEPAFFGGKILDSAVSAGPWPGRIVFRFEAIQSLKGTKTPKAGWAMEMKLVD